MNKPRTKSELKRNQILDAATVQFIQHGYTATSMEHIAKLAGVSKQTVYSHFGNKDELFITAISYKCELLGVAELLPENLGPVEPTLVLFAQRFFAMITSADSMAVHRTCAAECLAHPHLSRLFFEAGPLFVIDKLANCLAEYHRRGELDIEDCRQAAIQLLAIIKGEQWTRLEFNIEESLSEQEINHYLQSSVRLFVRGYQNLS